MNYVLHVRIVAFLLIYQALYFSQAIAETSFQFQQLGVFPTSGPVGPIGGLLQVADGTLYGTTQHGVGYGSVFKITTGGQLETLVGFSGFNGFYPLAGLAQGTNGNLYGTTSEGGPENGFGTVFSLTPSGELSTLHTFRDADGHRPHAYLCLAADGYLYGTTEYGGTNANGGTVFKISHDGQFTTLVSFNGTNGLYPRGEITQGTDGNLYGTTTFAGPLGGGTIFSMTPSGDLKTVFSFVGTNGRSPSGGLVQTSEDTFYGTTEEGGDHDFGTIFRFNTNGTLTSIFSFNGANGKFPIPGLAKGLNGKFYGTTLAGGDNGSGTIFEFTSDGNLTTLVSFNETNGFAPYAKLTEGADGNLYGTTASGGVTQDGWKAQGTFFRLVQVPSFLSTSVSNNLVQLQWSSFAGGVYQMESKSRLADADWMPLGGRITANGDVTAATEVMDFTLFGFYRLVVLPW